ncbi:hypothetical protein [Microcoleus sp.]|uniref:hypothetical protein n=1 Tax=Microcoleus sp. TaxID=44472 RepID=UPI0035942E9F
MTPRINPGACTTFEIRLSGRSPSNSFCGGLAQDGIGSVPAIAPCFLVSRIMHTIYLRYENF